MLPLTVDKIDIIPENQRGAYVEKNGKFVLDVEIEDTSGLKAKIAEKIAENKKLAERTKLLGERTPEEIQADFDLAAKAREQKAKDEGNFEELKKLQAIELAKKDDAIKATETEIYDLVARNGAIEAITAAGGKVKKLLEPVLKHVRVVKEGDKRVAKVVDAKGNPRIVDGQGTEMTLAQLVETFKNDDDYAVDFAASGASGSGSRNGGGGGGGGGMVIIPKDASPQEYRRLKAEAEKAGRPYQVAS
jgi:galactokinase